MGAKKWVLRFRTIGTSLKPLLIHAFAQTLALIGSLLRIPLILIGISQLEFSAILICLQFLGLSGLIFGATRLFSRNPQMSYQPVVSGNYAQNLTREILSHSGWLFCLGFLNAQFFLLFFLPGGNYGVYLSLVLTLLSTLLFGFSSYFGALTGVLDSQNKYNGVALSDIASTIVMIPLTYFAVRVEADPWIYLIIGSLTLFNSGAYALLRLRNERIFHPIHFKTNWTYIKGIRGRMGQGLGAFLSSNFDLVIIGKLGNQADVIDYSVTSRLNLAVDLPSAANAPRQWMQVAKFTEGQNDFASNLRKLNLRFTLGNLLLVSPIAIFISILYQPYMQTLFGAQYNPNYTLLWSILCGRIIYTTYSTLYLSLSTPSKVKVFTRLGIYIGLLNILFSCLLMQTLPLIGPAIGTAIASLIGIAVILLVNHRESAIGASS